MASIGQLASDDAYIDGPSKRRGSIARAGAVLASSLLVLAACAPREAPPATTPPPPPVEEDKAEAPRPEARHRIAILVPLSGPNAAVGVSLANAATLALADTGKNDIRLTSYDTAALGAAVAAQRALADGAELVLGPLLSSNIPAVRAATASRNITMLSFSNDAAAAGGNVYVLGFQPAQSVARVVSHASERGLKRFAALIPNGTYGQRASVAFSQAVAAEGGQVVALTNFARSKSALPAAAREVTDYDSRVKKAGAAARRPDGTIAPISTTLEPIHFDALLVADSGVIANGFMPLLARFGAEPGSFLLMGTELWNTESNLRNQPQMRGAIFASVPDRRFQSMATRYRARFGATPSRLSSLSYDAMLLAASAAGGNWKLEQPFPAQVLADRKGFAGIDGIFRFRGNVAERGLAIQQIDAGGFTTISPAPSAFE